MVTAREAEVPPGTSARTRADHHWLLEGRTATTLMLLVVFALAAVLPVSASIHLVR